VPVLPWRGWHAGAADGPRRWVQARDADCGSADAIVGKRDPTATTGAAKSRRRSDSDDREPVLRSPAGTETESSRSNRRPQLQHSEALAHVAQGEGGIGAPTIRVGSRRVGLASPLRTAARQPRILRGGYHVRFQLLVEAAIVRADIGPRSTAVPRGLEIQPLASKTT